ncbi:MAG: hypothetical protein HFI09_04120, partial [Bacilli bacterium]|nr:hypothetical protein [Bacilli bacterium]
DGYKNISKETDKLIQQFNKKTDQIIKEKVALDNLKAKYNQLMSFSKAPSALIAMETQSKKLQSDLNDLIIRKEKLQNSGIGNNDKAIFELDKQISNVENKLGNLDEQMKTIKLNPEASAEVQNLKVKIEIATERIRQLKKEANATASQITSNDSESSSDQQKNNGIEVFKNIANFLVGSNGLDKGISQVTSKIDSLKKRITRLASTVMIFRLLRSALTTLSNGFMSLLSSNNQFSGSLNQIKVNLMTAFTPIYNYVLPAINTLMNALSKITGTIATFVSGIFGQTASQAKQNAKSLYNQAKAQNAVNEAQESLASFDKLEVNNDESSNGSKSEGLNFDSGNMQINENLLNFMNEIKSLIGDGKWFDVGSKLAESLNNVLSQIDVKGFFDKGTKIAICLIQGFNGFINTFDFKLLAEKINDFILGLGNLILTSLVMIDWTGIGTAIGDFILGIDWWGILVNILSIVSALIDVCFELIVGLLFSIGKHLLEWIPTIWDLLKTIPDWINDNVLKPLWNLIKHIGETILDAISLLLESIKNGVKLCWDGVVSILSVVASWFWEHVIKPVGDFIVNMWKGLIDGAVKAWEGVKEVFGSVATFFGKVFGDAWKKVKDVFSTGGKVFDGIKDGIISAFKAVVNALIKGINTIVATPFKGLNNILQKIHDISFLGISPFTWLNWRAPIPEIPFLAQGAVIPPNKKFAAVLGDQKNGNNLEGPESLFRKIVREETGDKDVVMNATFIVQADTGEEFGRATLKGLHLLQNIDGKTYVLN